MLIRQLIFHFQQKVATLSMNDLMFLVTVLFLSVLSICVGVVDFFYCQFSAGSVSMDNIWIFKALIKSELVSSKHQPITNYLPSRRTSSQAGILPDCSLIASHNGDSFFQAKLCRILSSIWKTMNYSFYFSYKLSRDIFPEDTGFLKLPIGFWDNIIPPT